MHCGSSAAAGAQVGAPGLAAGCARTPARHCCTAATTSEGSTCCCCLPFSAAVAAGGGLLHLQAPLIDERWAAQPQHAIIDAQSLQWGVWAGGVRPLCAWRTISSPPCLSPICRLQPPSNRHGLGYQTLHLGSFQEALAPALHPPCATPVPPGTYHPQTGCARAPQQTATAGCGSCSQR